MKCWFLGYCEGTKAYRIFCLETKKIIKSVVFFEDKMHFEDCPSGRVDGEPTVKVDVSSKLEEEELEANDNVLEADEEFDVEEKAEANLPAMKSICSGEASKFETGKKIATIPPPPTLQYGNKTMGSSCIRIGHANRLGMMEEPHSTTLR